MSNTLVVFINFNNIAPLKKNAIELFDKGLFYFNFDEVNFVYKLKNFYLYPFSQINKLWQEKSTDRKILIQNFVSSKKNLKTLIYLKI